MWCPADALFQLAKKANATGEMDCAPAPPAPQVFLGEQYVNNPTLSDVTFLVQVRNESHHLILELILILVPAPCIANTACSASTGHWVCLQRHRQS